MLIQEKLLKDDRFVNFRFYNSGRSDIQVRDVERSG